MRTSVAMPSSQALDFYDGRSGQYGHCRTYTVCALSSPCQCIAVSYRLCKAIIASIQLSSLALCLAPLVPTMRATDPNGSAPASGL